MNPQKKLFALAIVATIGVLTFQHNSALARVLNSSEQVEVDVPHDVAINDWTPLPQDADTTTEELPVFADVAAAHSAATKLVDCIQLENAKHEAEFRLTWTTQKMSLRDVERHERLLAQLKATIAALEANHACAGFTAEEASKNVYPTLLAAAKLGDTASAACYASALTPLPRGGKSIKDIQVFRANANEFVREGIARGDWRFVEIMTQATGKLGYRSDWFGHLERPTREQGYRYRRLMRLAATGNLAVDLDDELASLAAKMPPETIQSMDKQAQADYDKHFAKSPSLAERPDACEMN